MTIENEQSKKISNDELLTDIRLTETELEAYQKLQSGFAILNMLPETQSKYIYELRKYGNLEIDCANFLRQLYELKNERGI